MTGDLTSMISTVRLTFRGIIIHNRWPIYPTHLRSSRYYPISLVCSVCMYVTCSVVAVRRSRYGRVPKSQQTGFLLHHRRLGWFALTGSEPGIPGNGWLHRLFFSPARWTGGEWFARFLSRPIPVSSLDPFSVFSLSFWQGSMGNNVGEKKR